MSWMGAEVFSSFARLVLSESSVGIGADSRVERPVSTLDDINSPTESFSETTDNADGCFGHALVSHAIDSLQ